MLVNLAQQHQPSPKSLATQPSLIPEGIAKSKTMEQSRSPSSSRSVDESARKRTKRSDVACERCHKNKTVCDADVPLVLGCELRVGSRSPEMLVSFLRAWNEY